MTRFVSIRVLCLVVALGYWSCAAYQLWAGSASTPLPLRELCAFLLSYESETAAHLVVGLEFGLGAAVLAAGTRVAGVLGAGLLGFVALSSVSASLRTGSFLPSFLMLVVAVGLLLWSRWIPRPAPRASERRGLSPAWSAFAGIAAGTVASHLAAHTSFKPDRAIGEAEARARAMSIDLDLKPYIGIRLKDSPLASYLPAVIEEVGDDTAFIIFYNPLCDACHTLFDSVLMEPRTERFFAIEIPLAADAVVAPHEELGPIECPPCVFDSLPPGPLWLIAPPMTVKVERGVITCVADRFGGDCFNPK